MNIRCLIFRYFNDEIMSFSILCNYNIYISAFALTSLSLFIIISKHVNMDNIQTFFVVFLNYRFESFLSIMCLIFKFETIKPKVS